MHVVSQIIERNLHRCKNGHSGLWINPEKDDTWRKAKVNGISFQLICQEYGSYQYHQASGAEVDFSAFLQTGNDKYHYIALNLPREKALLRMMLDCAVSLLAEDGVFLLAGENKTGIKSANKLLKLYFGQVRKLDNARHCILYEAKIPLNPDEFIPHSYRQEWVLNCQDSAIKVMSYPGVFAHGRLDAGTALLLEAVAEMEIGGDVLDFACGAGPIGAFIAECHPHSCVTLLDNNALALRACEETLAANHLNGTVMASDGLSEVNNSFDLIISNPPIHAGVKTDNHLGLRLLEAAHEHLNPGGMLMLVANLHLPYENWLSQHYKRHEQLLSNDNYKVILAKI